MFSSFLHLRNCVLNNHHKFPLSKESISHLLDLFQKKEDAAISFVRSLEKPTVYPKSLDEVVGRGGYGVVYNDKNGNAVKFYRQNHTYSIKEDSNVIESFAENIMFYVLFKVVLTRAYKLELTKTNLADFILDINEIFSSKEPDGWIIGYTSKLYENEWNEKYTPTVYGILTEFYSLTEHGVFLTHGDITVNNIIIDDNEIPHLIDFDISSVVIKFHDTVPVINRRGRRTGPPILQYTSGVLQYFKEEDLVPKDLVLVDLVMFGCRQDFVEESYEKLENTFGKYMDRDRNWHDVIYENFLGADIDFWKVMNIFTGEKQTIGVGP